MITIGDLIDNKINTIQDLENFLDKKNIIGKEREEYISLFNKTLEILKKIYDYMRNVKFQLDMPEGESIEEKIEKLNNFLDDDEKITSEASIPEVIKKNRKYLNAIKKKQYFKEKKKKKKPEPAQE